MKNPIFIVGCDRSGTTLLSLVLNECDDLNVTLESGFLPKLRSRTEEYGDFSESRQRWYFVRDLQYTHATPKTFALDIFDISDTEAEAAVCEVAPTDYPGACRAVFRADARAAGAMRWANKTPKYIQHIDWLAEAFEDAQFVHIIRDPRDVAASLMRAGWHPTYREAADYWKKQVRAGRESGSHLEDRRYTEVFYEDLVLKPKEEIKKISERLSIDVGNNALQFYETADEEVHDEHKYLFPLIDQPIDPSRAYAWKREMDKKAVADVESEVLNVMEEFGYGISGAEIPVWVKWVRSRRNKLIWWGKKAKEKIEKI